MIQSSDINLCVVKKDSSYGLNEVLKLQPKVLLTYENTEYIRVIAQDVQKVMPELVGISFEDYIGYDNTSLTAVLIQAVKELNEKIEVLENKLNTK